MAHTPGPWVVLPGKEWPEEEADLVAEADLDRSLAVLPRGAGANPADASLIAAAPDLLEACKRQHAAIDMLFALLITMSPRDDVFYQSKCGEPWEAARLGQVAIAKAEGGQPDG